MDSQLRASIAAAVVAHSTGRQVASVYDHDLGEHRGQQAHAAGARIACYDTASGLRLSGELPNLLWSPERVPIHLHRAEGGDYRGFDHGSETHFEVRPDGLSVQLYDHGEQKWFAYSAHPAGF